MIDVTLNARRMSSRSSRIDGRCSVSRKRAHDDNDDARRGKRGHRYERKSEERDASRSGARSDRESSRSRRDAPSTEDRGDEDFRFGRYKCELNKIFAANANLVHDVADFWRFVDKYESAVKRQLGDSDGLDESPDVNSIGVPRRYRKSHCVNFRLGLSHGELFARVPDTKQLTRARLLKFRDVIVLYLDFKQKEKFGKLRKLRDMQTNLPVARYKEEIIETIRREKVVIIAGDTGCGKSTQVPQYLYEAGFQKIG